MFNLPFFVRFVVVEKRLIVQDSNSCYLIKLLHLEMTEYPFFPTGCYEAELSSSTFPSSPFYISSLLFVEDFLTYEAVVCVEHMRQLRWHSSLPDSLYSF